MESCPQERHLKSIKQNRIPNQRLILTTSLSFENCWLKRNKDALFKPCCFDFSMHQQVEEAVWKALAKQLGSGKELISAFCVGCLVSEEPWKASAHAIPTVISKTIVLSHFRSAQHPYVALDLHYETRDFSPLITRINMIFKTAGESLHSLCNKSETSYTLHLSNIL